MKTKIGIRILVVLGAAVAAAACAGEKPQVRIASSAGEPGYAAAYPERFDAENRAFDAIAVDARAGMAELQGFPAQIASSDWTVVRGAYERADAAGRGGAYAEGVRDDEAVRRFFDEERDDVGRRVTNGVNAHLQKELTGVEVDVSGPVAYGLKDGVQKRMERRLEAANEGRQYLDRHAYAVGKKDLEAVERQVDAIARVSRLVHVAYVESRLRVAGMRGEARDVQRTLDAEIESEGARCADPALAKDDRAACEERLAGLRTARARLDVVAGGYARDEEKVQAEQDALAKEYEAAFGALLDAVDEKIENAPPPVPAK